MSDVVRRVIGMTDTRVVQGAVADSPWDPALAAALHERGRAVVEKRIIPELLTDLAHAAVASVEIRTTG